MPLSGAQKAAIAQQANEYAEESSDEEEQANDLARVEALEAELKALKEKL